MSNKFQKWCQNKSFNTKKYCIANKKKLTKMAITGSVFTVVCVAVATPTAILAAKDVTALYTITKSADAKNWEADDFVLEKNTAATNLEMFTYTYEKGNVAEDAELTPILYDRDGNVLNSDGGVISISIETSKEAGKISFSKTGTDAIDCIDCQLVIYSNAKTGTENGKEVYTGDVYAKSDEFNIVTKI